MISLVVENHPYRGLADFRHKLVRCLAYTGSTFSGVGASDKPGAVQWSVGGVVSSMGMQVEKSLRAHTSWPPRKTAGVLADGVAAAPSRAIGHRSAVRRVGNECVSTFRSRWSHYLLNEPQSTTRHQ